MQTVQIRMASFTASIQARTSQADVFLEYYY